MKNKLANDQLENLSMKPMENREPVALYGRATIQDFAPAAEPAEPYPLGKRLKDFFQRPKSATPPHLIPFIKTDLNKLQSEKPVVVWFGHSSYLVHYKGANILVDPVFSAHSFPFPFTVKAFPGSDAFTTDDLPALDVLIITNNHYDHFDKKAIARLKDKTTAFCAPLGVGKYLEACTVDKGAISELGCWETKKLTEHIRLTATPVQHFSGSGFRRTGLLWSSFVLELDGYRIYLGGDSGYGAHFREIGERFGSFDLAVLECGQYDASPSSVHMLPEEVIHAGRDLNARWVLPVHWGKFAMANHPWDEPITRVVKAAGVAGVPITTPLIGERVVLDSYYPKIEWWTL